MCAEQVCVCLLVPVDPSVLGCVWHQGLLQSNQSEIWVTAFQVFFVGFVCSHKEQARDAELCLRLACVPSPPANGHGHPEGTGGPGTRGWVWLVASGP